MAKEALGGGNTLTEWQTFRKGSKGELGKQQGREAMVEKSPESQKHPPSISATQKSMGNAKVWNQEGRGYKKRNPTIVGDDALGRDNRHQ